MTIKQPKPPRVWWRYAVLRGEGIPANLDGVWFDIQHMDNYPMPTNMNYAGYPMDATNMWEQRDDGEVAVVYRLRPLQ